MYQVPQHIDNNKIFIVQRSEIEGRLDAQYYKMSVHIPNSVKLSSFASVKGGKRIPKGYSYSEERTPYYYLRVADMDNDNELSFDSLKFINEEVFNILKRYEIKEGELAISIAGTIGKICYLSDVPDGHRVILTENCAKIVISNENVLNARYLEILFKMPFIQKQLERNYIQTTIPKLGLDKIASLNFPRIPTLEFQRKVVDYYTSSYKQKLQKESEAQQLLDSIDAYILNELGITLPEIKIDLKSRMFLVNRSELEARLDPYYSQEYFKEAFNALANGNYPLYSIKSLSSLITSGITPKSGGEAYTDDKETGIPFIRSGNIDINGNFDFEDLLYLKPEIHESIMKSSQVHKNDLMIAIVGATIGQVGIFLDEREANINQAIALVRLKDGNDVQYIKELIKSNVGQLSLNRLKRPVARANINLEEISTIKVPLPPLVKQQEIANHIYAIRQQAKQLQEEGKTILENAKKEVEQMIIG